MVGGREVVFVEAFRSKVPGNWPEALVERNKFREQDGEFKENSGILSLYTDLRDNIGLSITGPFFTYTVHAASRDLCFLVLDTQSTQYQ